jgi:signal transduction histidine kinase
MKRKGGMLKDIVLRFIGFYLAIEAVNSLLEDSLNFFLPGTDNIFLNESLPAALAAMEPGETVMVITWYLLQLLAGVAGIVLFARSINRLLKKQMKEREEERMQLFSNIAHDLKTPITTVMGYAGALANGMVAEPGKQKEYHLAIKAKADQMNGLIDQLLAYSKVGASGYRMNFTQVDLAELLRVACASLFGEIEGKKMDPELRIQDDPVFCKADSLELNRAVGNLLTNAIRHNPEGTLLSVALEVKPEYFDIQIADSGAAISDTVAKSMFEPFVSGDGARITGSGTGLGLAIVKKVAEQHGGEVLLTDAPPPYTKMFVLRLPKSKKNGGLYVR